MNSPSYIHHREKNMRVSRSILDELMPTPEPLVGSDSNNLVVDYAYNDYKRPSSASNFGLAGAYTSDYGVNSRAGGYGHGGGHGGQEAFTN